MGYSPRGCKESDTTERWHFHFHFPHLLLFSVYKRNWHSDPDKMVRWGTSLPSSREPSFPNTVVFLASKKKKKKNFIVYYPHPWSKVARDFPLYSNHSFSFNVSGDVIELMTHRKSISAWIVFLFHESTSVGKCYSPIFSILDQTPPNS